MTSRTEVLYARAKLTLSLRITGVRPDGYHLLDSEMVTLDLADRLTVSDGDGLTVTALTSPGVGGSVLSTSALSGSLSSVSSGSDNLVARALVLMGRTASVSLEKAIPAGAGLGGGSADAAAILRWAGCTDLVAAASLGADVPFCLVGGRARVRGVGEVLDPLPFEPMDGRVYTLLVPPFHVSTVEVYREWDRMGGPEGPNENDLEPAALRVEPRLVEWRDRLGESTGETPRLAGSGGTWFVAGAYPGGDRLVVRIHR